MYLTTRLHKGTEYFFELLNRSGEFRLHMVCAKSYAAAFHYMFCVLTPEVVDIAPLH